MGPVRERSQGEPIKEHLKEIGFHKIKRSNKKLFSYKNRKRNANLFDIILFPCKTNSGNEKENWNCAKWERLI